MIFKTTFFSKVVRIDVCVVVRESALYGTNVSMKMEIHEINHILLQM